MKNKVFENINISQISQIAQYIYNNIEKKIEGKSIVIKLNGNLGAGKTTLIKEILKLNTTDDITSPTFALVNEYHGKYKIYHIDFYRINTIDELYDIGLTDYFIEENTITFIEWADLFPDILPNNCWEIQINYNNDKRDYIIIYYE